MMIPLEFIFFAASVHALPVTFNNTTNSPSISTPNGPALTFINPTGKTALLWTSIGLAVVTSFWQGLIVTIVTIAEDQGMWTFRFRIARFEHWWWITVSILLFSSFVLIVLSFLSGNSSDSLGVLTLSTATAITIVRYAIPAWRNRRYTRLRWLSWTGPSRTAISTMFGKYCGEKSDWVTIQKIPRKHGIVPTPSDEWGWAVNPLKGIWQDPTALLQGLNTDTIDCHVPARATGNFELGPCVYDDGYDGVQVSLLWGENEGFRRRVSRAIKSMPNPLLNSFPSTYDGFNGTGLCLAMGILGRNKGLAPFQLVFDIDDGRKNTKGIHRSDTKRTVHAELEATSAWFPRPNKVMRSFYRKAMEEQYSTLGVDYVGAAVELALILLDCPEDVTQQWLEQSLEQQLIELNQIMSGRNKLISSRATQEQLQTLYRASYTSMIISINYYNRDLSDLETAVRRPDLSCFALLWIAEGKTSPEWWKEEWVKKQLHAEAKGLKGDWKRAASWLLGLGDKSEILDTTGWPVDK